MDHAQTIDPLWLFALAFLVGALAGVARLLRGSQPITVRTVLSAVLNNSLFVLAAAFVCYAYADANPYLLVGLITLAAMGGMPLFDFVLSILRMGGINVDVRIAGSSENDAPLRITRKRRAKTHKE